MRQAVHIIVCFIFYNERNNMTTKQEAIAFCLTLSDVYEDYPFHDDNWCVIRHKKCSHGYLIRMDMSGLI